MRISPTSLFDRPMGRPDRRTLVRILVIVAGLIAGVVTIGTISSARSMRDSYGRRIEVAVARTDLAVGQVITERDIERRDLPAGLLAEGLDPNPTSRTVTEPILAGEPIPDRRLSGSTAAGIDALIGPGARAVSIERDSTTPPIGAGDRVDLLAPAVRGGAVRVARRALVVAADDRAITVAVTEAELPAVAGASLDKILSVALIGAG